MIKKYSINIAGHATSVSLEPEFWGELVRLAATKRLTLPTLISQIDKNRGRNNLSSALRLFVINELKR